VPGGKLRAEWQEVSDRRGNGDGWGAQACPRGVHPRIAGRGEAGWRRAERGRGQDYWCSQEQLRHFGSAVGEVARVVKESSDSGVKLEQATESVATANGPGLRRYVRRRKEKKIAFALVVPFQVMMIDVLVQRPA
jgi:hypothetical protein